MEKAPKPIPAVEAGKTCIGDVSAGSKGAGQCVGQRALRAVHIAVRDGTGRTGAVGGPVRSTKGKYECGMLRTGQHLGTGWFYPSWAASCKN